MRSVSGELHREVVRASLNGLNPTDNPASTLMALMRAALIGETASVASLLERGADANASDKYGRTPLIEAAFAGHADTVEALIKGGGDVNARDKDGWTALMEAASKGHIETVRILLANGADPYARNRYGWTVTRVMARDNPELIEMIQSRS
jgi:ankyrin repeat protein